VTDLVPPPIRLTVVMTHPIQYYAPWFRYIAQHCPELEVTVLYATEPTPEQQGIGFGLALRWDVPLTEGYRCRILRPARPGDSVGSDSFRGIDVPDIGAAILDTRPDVVLVPGWHSITLVRALWSCHRAGLPLLYRGDSHLGREPGGLRGIGRRLRTRILLRAFDGYLAVGRRASDYVRRLGAPAARVFPSPHAVDNAFFAASAAPFQKPAARQAARARFGLGAGDFVALFVGKLEAKKRPLDLVRGMAKLGPGGRLLVVGGGPLERACRDEAEALGVRAAWAGVLNQTELGAAYAAADCLVLPSESETWGLVVNEALATGLPCIVSDRVGCAPDLVMPGRTGDVFPLGDVEALARALRTVRDRARAGHDWSPACRARASAHSFERATAGLVAACREVAGHRPAPVSADRGSPRVVACCGGMVTISGLERMTFEVLGVLRERGAAVHCIVNSWENHRVVERAERIGAGWSTGYYWYPFRRTLNPLAWAQFAWDIGWTSLGLLRDALRLRATHVLVPEFSSALRNAPALALLRLGGVRVILRLGNAPEPGLFYRWLWRGAIDPVVDLFVCNSRFTERELLAHGILSRKSRLVYNAVPSRDGRAAGDVARDPRKLVYVGQVIPGKGVDVLLEAVDILRRRGHDVALDVVGDMEGWVSPSYAGYRERLRARAAAPDLAGHVTFLGQREDAPDLLAAAAVHCCPSLPHLREGFGLVNIEAKQAGTPSVVFPTGALPELIEHGRDGWVCAAATAEALAEGIEFFLADPGRREEAGRRAEASLARFGRDRFARAWWAVFRGPGADLASVPASVEGGR
jgi:glycosyltransferase involved in cell wall biosynthesis